MTGGGIVAGCLLLPRFLQQLIMQQSRVKTNKPPRPAASPITSDLLRSIHERPSPPLPPLPPSPDGVKPPLLLPLLLPLSETPVFEEQRPSRHINPFEQGVPSMKFWSIAKQDPAFSLTAHVNVQDLLSQARV